MLHKRNTAISLRAPSPRGAKRAFGSKPAATRWLRDHRRPPKRPQTHDMAAADWGRADGSWGSPPS
eukprot:7233026-Heterocapsa_arctica.AAC.1